VRTVTGGNPTPPNIRTGGNPTPPNIRTGGNPTPLYENRNRWKPNSSNMRTQLLQYENPTPLSRNLIDCLAPPLKRWNF
jgi:hypothetical protein